MTDFNNYGERITREGKVSCCTRFPRIDQDCRFGFGFGVEGVGGCGRPAETFKPELSGPVG